MFFDVTIFFYQNPSPSPNCYRKIVINAFGISVWFSLPLKYSPTIALQGDIQLACPHRTIKLNVLLCNLPSFHKHYSNEKPFRTPLSDSLSNHIQKALTLNTSERIFQFQFTTCVCELLLYLHCNLYDNFKPHKTIMFRC